MRQSLAERARIVGAINLSASRTLITRADRPDGLAAIPGAAEFPGSKILLQMSAVSIPISQ